MEENPPPLCLAPHKPLSPAQKGYYIIIIYCPLKSKTEKKNKEDSPNHAKVQIFPSTQTIELENEYKMHQYVHITAILQL